MEDQERFAVDASDFVETLIARQTEFEQSVVHRVEAFEQALLQRQEAFEASMHDGVRGIVDGFARQNETYAQASQKVNELIEETSAVKSLLAASLIKPPRTGGGSIN